MTTNDETAKERQALFASEHDQNHTFKMERVKKQVATLTLDLKEARSALKRPQIAVLDSKVKSAQYVVQRKSARLGILRAQLSTDPTVEVTHAFMQDLKAVSHELPLAISEFCSLLQEQVSHWSARDRQLARVVSLQERIIQLHAEEVGVWRSAHRKISVDLDRYESLHRDAIRYVGNIMRERQEWQLYRGTAESQGATDRQKVACDGYVELVKAKDGIRFDEQAASVANKYKSKHDGAADDRPTILHEANVLQKLIDSLDSEARPEEAVSKAVEERCEFEVRQLNQKWCSKLEGWKARLEMLKLHLRFTKAQVFSFQEYLGGALNNLLSRTVVGERAWKTTVAVLNEDLKRVRNVRELEGSVLRSEGLKMARPAMLLHPDAVLDTEVHSPLTKSPLRLASQYSSRRKRASTDSKANVKLSIVAERSIVCAAVAVLASLAHAADHSAFGGMPKASPSCDQSHDSAFAYRKPSTPLTPPVVYGKNGWFSGETTLKSQARRPSAPASRRSVEAIFPTPPPGVKQGVLSCGLTPAAKHVSGEKAVSSRSNILESSIDPATSVFDVQKSVQAFEQSSLLASLKASQTVNAANAAYQSAKLQSLSDYQTRLMRNFECVGFDGSSESDTI
ncbi:hypothetical protein DIPPA_70129 [Diplonema papillatum]|nr:hypothetical protein DIPPA_70129 [Diplonema papillatum]